MTKDEWRLLRYGFLAALLMVLVLVPILRYKTFPRSLAEVILGVIALAVFALSKYMDRRWKITLNHHACAISAHSLSA